MNGGSTLEASIEPCHAITGIELENVERQPNVRVRSMVSGLPSNIADRQATRARELLEEMGLNVEVEQDIRRDGLGTSVAIEIDTRPVKTVFTALGARGKLAEAVAEEAVDQEKWLHGAGWPPSIAFVASRPVDRCCLGFGAVVIRR